VVLAILDRKWREHLYEMDYLQEGIGLRAMGQRDPVVEYQREGFDMFQTMMEGIKEESVQLLFNAEVQVAGRDTEAAPAAPPAVPVAPVASGDTAVAPEPPAPQAPGAGKAPAAAEPAAPAQAPPPVFVKGLEPRRPVGGLKYTAPSVDGGTGSTVTTTVTNGGFGTAAGPGGGTARGGGEAGAARPARNAPCPCGSGRKFKRCHGDPARRND
ncbi:SEC-C metal-binding domain-containing protein, partial [Frankia sp. EI5c]|uniref:SEC-C metal-binding domain-containing protein n=1 Tax=Frankia sp. EI5c TaxID=683316 RepID=UPI001F5B27CE